VHVCVLHLENIISRVFEDLQKTKAPNRSFTVLDPTLVSLIIENPRYIELVPKEVLGKFVSHQMMVRDAKYIDDVTNGSTSFTESQVVAFKATNEKEVIPNKVAQVEAGNLNDEEMVLVV
jgi:hypothetical protein